MKLQCRDLPSLYKSDQDGTVLEFVKSRILQTQLCMSGMAIPSIRRADGLVLDCSWGVDHHLGRVMVFITRVSPLTQIREVSISTLGGDSLAVLISRMAVVSGKIQQMKKCQSQA